MDENSRQLELAIERLRDLSAQRKELIAARQAKFDVEHQRVETERLRIETEQTTLDNAVTAIRNSEMANLELAAALSLSLIPAATPDNSCGADIADDNWANLGGLDWGDLVEEEEEEEEEGAEKARELEVRKKHEEIATADVLGDVQQFQLPAQVCKHRPGTKIVSMVRIGNRLYNAVECGASHGIHHNLCGYMAITHGDRAAAVALKSRLAPAATELSRRIGAHTAYIHSDTPADMEVFRVYTVMEKTPICIFNVKAGTAVSLVADNSENDCIYLLLDGGHYQRLVLTQSSIV